MHSEERAQLICILCNPRSGSNALRGAFASNRLVMDCGEVFHDDRALADPSFLDFLEQWRAPLLGLLDHREAQKLSEAFLASLRARARGRSILIDVKHNSWGTIRPLWRFPHEPPLFLHMLKENETRFLFLKRRDLAAQVVSFHLATVSGNWHDTLTEEKLAGSIEPHAIPTQRARELCVLFARAESLLIEFLGPYFYQLAIDYEDLFAGDSVTAAAADEIRRFTGLEVDTAPLPLKRNRVDKRQLVSNYDEVCAIAEQVGRELARAA